MQTIISIEHLENFISHLVDKFSNRRAMKDEFNKAGLL